MTYFYPRSPCGERRLPMLMMAREDNFYPRSPCGERLKTAPARLQGVPISIHALLAESDQKRFGQVYNSDKFLSTLSLRRATIGKYAQYAVTGISIHALLAESDETQRILLEHFRHFYPRSPCGERRASIIQSRFMSYFYPRSPCGERPTFNLGGQDITVISIHALLAESDLEFRTRWELGK